MTHAPLPPDPAFDAGESERRRQEGIALAAANRREILAVARSIAVELATANPAGITADDVVAAMCMQGYSPYILGPSAGALFRGHKWECTGEYRRSVRVSNHARILWVWRLA